MSRKNNRAMASKLGKLTKDEIHIIIANFVKGLFSKPWYNRIGVAFSIIFKRKIK